MPRNTIGGVHNKYFFWCVIANADQYAKSYDVHDSVVCQRKKGNQILSGGGVGTFK